MVSYFSQNKHNVVVSGIAYKVYVLRISVRYKGFIVCIPFSATFKYYENIMKAGQWKFKHHLADFRNVSI